MMAMKGSVLSDKKDLHVGGIGASVPGAPTLAAPWVEAPADAATRLVQLVRAAVQNTDSMVRVSPWAAVGVAACVGLAIGYLFSRRT